MILVFGEYGLYAGLFHSRSGLTQLAHWWGASDINNMSVYLQDFCSSKAPYNIFLL